jgi:hypothetical protein
MRSRLMVCPALFWLILWAIPATAAEPLDSEGALRMTGSWSYSPPGASLLSFENTEYIRLQPGIVRWKHWYASTLDLQMMGNDVFAKRAEEAQPYIHTLYVTFARVGRTLTWSQFQFSGDLHGGLFYTNSMDELAAADILVETNRAAALGFSLGVRWTRGRFRSELQLGVAGMTGQSLASSRWELQFRLSRRWKIGVFSEGVTRGVELCQDKQDPACIYELQLVYGALYASWNAWRDWWLVFGLGVSSITLGTEALREKESTDPAIYLGIR